MRFFRKIGIMMEGNCNNIYARLHRSLGFAYKTRVRKLKFRCRCIQAFLLAALVYFFLPTYGSLAVGGISSTKLVVPGAGPLERGVIEAEPFFSLELIDDAGDTMRLGGGFRLTAGLFEDFEAGFNINYLDHEDSGLIRSETNFGDVDAGLKLRFLDQEEGHPLSLAYEAGLTIPVGEGAQWIVEPGGLILTRDFTEEFSMDADVVFGILENDSWSIVTEAGFGYYIDSKFQPVIEAAYAYEDPGAGGGVSVLNITGGFTWDPTRWFSVALGVTPDLYVENTDRQVLISSAFTFAF